MAYSFEVNTRVVVKDSNGNAITQVIGGVTRRISCAGEEAHHATATVADDYTKVTLWTTGDSGCTDFDALVVLSDADVLLELVEDYAGTPLYSTVKVLADIPLVLSSDDVMNVVATNNSQSTTDVIDQINVQNNVADAQGDAKVKLWLFS